MPPAKPRIVVLGKIPAELSSVLAAIGPTNYVPRNEKLSEGEIVAACKSADVVLTEPPDLISAAVLEACPDLIMIAQRAVGYYNINLKDCAARPVLVSNTPGVLDDATADLAFALLLAAGRRIVEADNYVRSGQWQGFENDLLLGCEMKGRTMGILGMGRIGSAMARRAHGFGMKIIYCRNGDQSSAEEMMSTGEKFVRDDKDRKWAKELGAQRVSMDELLSQSDFISLHCPHNKETEKLIGPEQFARMKKNCIFVNTSRGKVVDEESLCLALKAGQIRAAGLDVFFNEPAVPEFLLNAKNVVLAPHIGSASEETRFAMAELAVNAVKEAFAGKAAANILNQEVFARWQAKVEAMAGK